MNIAIIFAGGVGTRMHSQATPKQFLVINGAPIIIHTLNIFQKNPLIDKIYIAIVESHLSHMKNLVEQYGISKVAGIVTGGETGQDSIYNALICAKEDGLPNDTVALIHDGVRPIITDKVIRDNIESVLQNGTAITSTPSYETIFISQNGSTIESIPSRNLLHKAQAPQSFFLGDILAAHEEIRKRPQRYENIVDSCQLFFNTFNKVHYIEGNFGNIKVTTPEDVYILQGLFSYRDAVKKFGLEQDDII